MRCLLFPKIMMVTTPISSTPVTSTVSLTRLFRSEKNASPARTKRNTELVTHCDTAYSLCSPLNFEAKGGEVETVSGGEAFIIRITIKPLAPSNEKAEFLLDSFKRIYHSRLSRMRL